MFKLFLNAASALIVTRKGNASMHTNAHNHAIECKSCGGAGQIEVSVSAPIKLKCRVCDGAGKGVYV